MGKHNNTSERLISLIEDRLRDILDSEETNIDSSVNGRTELFGESGLLDSVGLVSLVVAVEQTIEDEFGVIVSLADERAMSQKKSPYRTIATLAAYAQKLLDAAG